MSDTARLFEEWAQKLAGTYLKDKRISVPATINSVDTDSLTCEVTTIGDDAAVTIPGVLLSAEVSDGFVVIPSVNSTVYIALTTRNQVFVEMYSDLDAVFISIPTGTPNTWTKVLINNNPNLFGGVTGIRFNDGSYGGLVIGGGSGNNLISQLNTLNQQLQAIITILTGTVIDEPGNGAPSALQAALKIALTGLSGPSFSGLLNNLITHGK